MSHEPLALLRHVCLALPDTSEVDSPAEAGFRVHDKTFAIRHRVGERASVWFKSGDGRELSETAPGRYFLPPYVHAHGWVGAWLDVEQDWSELTTLLRESYRMTVPEMAAGT